MGLGGEVEERVAIMIVPLSDDTLSCLGVASARSLVQRRSNAENCTTKYTKTTKTGLIIFVSFALFVVRKLWFRLRVALDIGGHAHGVPQV